MFFFNKKCSHSGIVYWKSLVSEKKEITDNNNNVVPYLDKNTIHRKEVPCHLNYQHKMPHVTSILSLT